MGPTDMHCYNVTLASSTRSYTVPVFATSPGMAAWKAAEMWAHLSGFEVVDVCEHVLF